MNKGIKNTLIGALCLSILVNLWMLMSIGYVALDYEDQIHYKDLEWCEFSNDQIEVINDLIEVVQYYDEDYLQVEYLEHLDCWGYEE